jgi:preprotein translocase subunit YajC
VPVHALLLASTPAKSSSSGSSTIFLLLILLLGVFVVFRFSSSQRRARARAAETRGAVAAGTRVMTSSGLYGTVTITGEDTVDLEIADGVVVTFAKAAVTRVIPAEDESGTGVTGADVPEAYTEQPPVDAAPSWRTSSES